MRSVCAFLACVGFAWACGSDDAPAKPKCTPGEQITCGCGGDRTGFQTCNEDGAGFGECRECGGGSTGGAGGSSGSGQAGASASAGVGATGGSGGSASGGASGAGGAAGAGGAPILSPECTDGTLSPNETDVDCGGICAPCADGKSCSGEQDCESSVCTGGVCQTPTCTDIVKNADETDIDCGGSTCPQCANGKGCKSPSDCLGNHCWLDACAECPYRMSKVPAPQGGSYCIDQIEVYNSAYEEFLDTSPSPSGQPPECSWNASFVPDSTASGCDGLYDPQTRADRPVTCVDWCDAVAYCAFRGKRLCGKIGGGAVDFLSYADASHSQWFNACSEQGIREYPMGSQLPGFPCSCIGGPGCAGSSLWGVRQGDCRGGYPGLEHLAGNAGEWEDACDGLVDGGSPGANDACRYRGGHHDHDDGSALRCDASASVARNTVHRSIGFRCCLD